MASLFLLLNGVFHDQITCAARFARPSVVQRELEPYGNRDHAVDARSGLQSQREPDPDGSRGQASPLGVVRGCRPEPEKGTRDGVALGTDRNERQFRAIFR